ncbi:MAG TPA: 50S ribosomal protein L22 [Candidatus Pacearchaeota archaeon]|nr:50S ribosomal protein L22 [Candidatus Pacearchaeota archaeon]HPR80032.1 50S ribosomal protein L22 [Candidatus Pacearchaeota archaeon]
MAFKVELNHLHIAPRKARLIADLVRGKKAEEAQTILNFAIKRASDPILKLLNSALANAKITKNISATDLFISKITVDEGPAGKRVLPKSRGRGEIIKKKTSHVTLVLDMKKEDVKKSKKGKKEIVKEEAKVEEKKVEKKVKKTITKKK